MVASPIIAAAGLTLVLRSSPPAWPLALPILALWAAAPLIAYVLSRPVRLRRSTLNADDREYLRSIALKTWRYFDAFVGPDDHALPPDNVQVVPELTIAHRTSPTNIGMALLATLAAHDFGFIDTADLAERIEATLTTVEGLERFEGHLLNWYDTQTLTPLVPSYVSTVDSGNLAGALLTLSAGLRLIAAGLQDDSASTKLVAHLENLAARS